MMRLNRLSGIAALVIVGAMAASSVARQPASPPPPAEPQVPAAVVDAPLAIVPGNGVCCDEAPPCCPKPCITYHHRRKRKACYDVCAGTTQIVLAVKDPCTCCMVEVPVCVPVCCQDVPCVDGRCGIFGRQIAEYSWNCGYRVQIVFTKRGDVRVTYIHG